MFFPPPIYGRQFNKRRMKRRVTDLSLLSLSVYSEGRNISLNGTINV
jgi:hypothetical protein